MEGMAAWEIALITVGGSVIAGVLASLVTGRFTLRAAVRQAEATLEAVRITAEEQRFQRLRDSRRQTYLDFLAAVDDVLAARGSSNVPGDRTALHRALGAVQLEGPGEVARAAEAVVSCLRAGSGRSPADQDRERQKFVDAAKDALASI